MDSSLFTTDALRAVMARRLRVLPGAMNFSAGPECTGIIALEDGRWALVLLGGEPEGDTLPYLLIAGDDPTTDCQGRTCCSPFGLLQALQAAGLITEAETEAEWQAIESEIARVLSRRGSEAVETEPAQWPEQALVTKE